MPLEKRLSYILSLKHEKPNASFANPCDTIWPTFTVWGTFDFFIYLISLHCNFFYLPLAYNDDECLRNGIAEAIHLDDR